MDPSPLRRRQLRTTGALLLAIGLPAAIAAVAFTHGGSGGRTASSGRAATPLASSAHLFLAIAVVVAAAAVGGRVAGLLRQPPVIGEICAGLMLGPSLLGRVAP